MQPSRLNCIDSVKAICIFLMVVGIGIQMNAYICLYMPILNGLCDLYGNDYGYSYLLASANAALANLLLFWLTSKFRPIKCIETISRGTLVVLGIHMPILHVLDYFLPDSLNLVLPLITIILCYYIIIICERFSPALLGKITINKERESAPTSSASVSRSLFLHFLYFLLKRSECVPVLSKTRTSSCSRISQTSSQSGWM